MAWPETLTADQQTAVTDFCNSVRAFSALLGRACSLGSAIGAAWAGGISTLVGDLESGDSVPNTSGLAGSQNLVPADISNLAGYATVISDPSNASQGTGSFNGAFIKALCVKAAGVNATL